MRIGFVSANRQRLPDPVVPIGLLSVMTATPDHHDKDLLDLCFAGDPQQALTAWLAEFRPQLVAIGLRNVQNSDYTSVQGNLHDYEALVATVRGLSSAPVVLGGAGFSVMPTELMDRIRPDFGLPGEGERSFPALVAALEAQAHPSSVPGLLWFDQARLVTNPPAGDFVRLDDLACPSRAQVDDRYYTSSGIESLQTKRGCPLSCEYCTYPLIEGSLSRARSPSLVVDDLEQLLSERPETEHVFIVDSVFNLPMKHAKAVCREMIDRSWSLPWTCYANPIRFDAELAALMAQAGCVGMEIGVDSGVDEVLLRQRKGFTTRDVLRMHELCVEAGLKDCPTFVLGISGDTTETVARTLAFVEELDPFAAIFMMWMDELEAVDPALATERLALREQIRVLLEAHCRANRRWIAPQLGLSFGPRLFGALRRAGMKGPLWQHIDRL
jgi:radical SAM superfamily enzyme YgiQ (UPF0313 family)